MAVIKVKKTARPGTRPKVNLADQVAMLKATAVEIDLLNKRAEDMGEQAKQAKAAYTAMVADLVKKYPELKPHVRQIEFTATNGDDCAVTYVERSESLRIDDAKLAIRLGSARWTRVTNQVLDKKKLEEAVDRGIVSMDEIEQCSIVVPAGEPYLRFTTKKNKPVEETEEVPRLKKKLK